MTSRVAVIKCQSYDYKEVQTAVARGLHLLGGLSAFASAHEKIILKPNLLAGDLPEKCVTLHPQVFRAVAELFKKSKANICYGDSPARGKPERTVVKAGLDKVASDLEIPLADFVNGQKISFPAGTILKQIYLAKGIIESDGIISLSKMKTHALTRITGAVKNLFGCIPGFLKGEFHVKMPDIYDFATVMVDINRYLKPRLHIMDGIEAMEGNGPRSGEPLKMKVLLFSTDPVALDMVFCRLVNLDPMAVPTLKIAADLDYGETKFSRIELLGDDLEDLIRVDFKVIRTPPDRFITKKFFPYYLKNLISPKPIIDKSKCTSCGNCISQCPTEPKALSWKETGNKPVPVYDYRICIRCYCCQEICPSKAITVRIPILGRLIHR